jgi:hypothetical protein
LYSFFGERIVGGEQKVSKVFQSKKRKIFFFSDEAWFHVELTNGHFQQDSTTAQTA